jgi:hypothetical protein
MLKKLWHDPVWSKVIATAILAAAGWVGYRRNWWSALWRGLVAAWAFLFVASPVQHWVLGLLIALALLFIVTIVFLAVILLQTKKQNQNPPDWQSYTSDNFYDLNWVWAYEGREIIFKAVMCPHCGYQVGPDSTSRFANSIRFYWDNCRRTVPVEGQSWESLQSVVIRLVQQKLRTGTYPKTGNVPESIPR